MSYVSESRTLGGNDLSSPSSAPSSWDRLRPTVVTDWFWAIVNFIVLFFHTMFKPNLTKKGSGYTTDYRRPGGGGGGPSSGPRRRMGGFRGGQSGPSPPPMGGG